MYHSLAFRWLLFAALIGACDAGDEAQGEPAADADDAAVAPDARAPRENTRDAGRSEDADVGPVSPNADAGGPKDAGPDARRPPRADAPGLCSRPASDAVRDVFCADEAPQIGSLRELQDKLGVSAAIATGDATPEQIQEALASYSIVDTLVVLGHSTALSGHLVSPINPRAIILSRPAMLAYQRGVQKVEIISPDREDNDINFYLVEFSQACNQRASGCNFGDLYTPRIENDWLNVVVRDDEDLKNTPQDCRQCHQRASDYPHLLIRELNGTWPHFFAPDPVGAPPDPGPFESGRELVQDFLRAKGDEPYGNIPSWMFRMTSGLTLQSLVTDAQPVIFAADRIEDERWPVGPNGYGSTPVRSPTWDRAYEAFKRGEQLALPHYRMRPTDPAKQARLTEAYRKYRAGELSADELPDFGDIYPDDPMLRAEIGLTTDPAATPAQALIQACGSCHNDVLDQSISRARFNIALSRMERAELDRAIQRIELAPDQEGVMPPPEARQLAATARKELVAYLRQEQRTPEDDALLDRAAELGMSGGGRQ